MTNRKIISAAWTENRPLKVWLSTNCIPGWASSARKIIASSPAMTKKKIVVTTYWIPITLWSVFGAEVVAPGARAVARVVLGHASADPSA